MMIDLHKMRWQLTIHEGIRIKPYLDSVGKLTIGVGRNLDDTELSDDEVELMLNNDIERAAKNAERFSWWRELDSVRQMVVVDMLFNLGLAGFAKFRKTISFIGAGDYPKAAEEMLDSKWASQVGSRAVRLAKMMRTGDWPFKETL
ncbi:MAG: glycoside hydrolase family protein [Proteobacteria bacterium]|nr:glycoside hydrolase family protein [Pseudomonadota bacterium]